MKDAATVPTDEERRFSFTQITQSDPTYDEFGLSIGAHVGMGAESWCAAYQPGLRFPGGLGIQSDLGLCRYFISEKIDPQDYTDETTDTVYLHNERLLKNDWQRDPIHGSPFVEAGIFWYASDWREEAAERTGFELSYRRFFTRGSTDPDPWMIMIGMKAMRFGHFEKRE